MAWQKGIIKWKGSIGDITFYKTQDSNLSREKEGVDGNRIASDPSFQRTRENGAEFGHAGKAGKLLRSSIRSLLFNASDSRMVGRTTHFKIVAGAVAIDFEHVLFDMVSAESDVLEWNAVTVPDLTLSNQFTEDNGYPLLFVLGIEFFQEVNGKLYSLKNGLFNPLSVVAVDIVK